MQDGNKLTYTYIGSSIDGKLSGTIKNMDQEIEYLYKDNEYYIIDNDQYYLVAEEDIFKVIDYKYLNINNINNYIKKGTQIYKTEYITPLTKRIKELKNKADVLENSLCIAIWGFSKEEYFLRKRLASAEKKLAYQLSYVESLREELKNLH